MLALFACCAGIYLGLHFNILALLPFSLLGAGAFIATSFFAGQNPFEGGATVIIVPMVAVQAGYMLGLTARGTYAQIRVRLKVSQSRRA
jgi:hypothetical protein